MESSTETNKSKTARECVCGGTVYLERQRPRLGWISRFVCDTCGHSTLWEAAGPNGEEVGKLAYVWEAAQTKRREERAAKLLRIAAETDNDDLTYIVALERDKAALRAELAAWLKWARVAAASRMRGQIESTEKLLEETRKTIVPQELGEALAESGFVSADELELVTDRQQRLAREGTDRLIADLRRANTRASVEG